MKIALFSHEMLKAKHQLFSTLAGENAPAWWSVVKEDKDLYIEVRKQNIIDIYFMGGRIAEAKYDFRTQKVKVTTHPKYMGHKDEHDSNYYRETINSKGKKIIAKYSDCEEWLTHRLTELKRNITDIYSKEDNRESTKEKLIQGTLIINGRDKYLDSEFAHQFEEGSLKTIRIDLIKIENNHFVFEELKRIRDNRLRNTDGTPEILIQMENYRTFLRVNQAALTKYYRNLYTIKKNLQLPIPKVTDINSVTIDPEPQLLIANNYEKMNDEREKRIEAINAALATIHIKPNYIRL